MHALSSTLTNAAPPSSIPTPLHHSTPCTPTPLPHHPSPSIPTPLPRPNPSTPTSLPASFFPLVTPLVPGIRSLPLPTTSTYPSLTSSLSVPSHTLTSYHCSELDDIYTSCIYSEGMGMIQPPVPTTFPALQPSNLDHCKYIFAQNIRVF